jgi:hypothetical protein
MTRLDDGVGGGALARGQKFGFEGISFQFGM